MNDFDNEIIEINDDENAVKENTLEEDKVLPSKENMVKKPKRSIKDKWNGLSKKKKIIIIVSIILVILVGVGITLYFTIFKKDDEVLEEKPKDVILEKDNYRYENGELVFLNLSDREIGRYECKNKNVDDCYVAKSDYSTDQFERIININEENTEIIKNSPIYDNNFVFVKDGEKLFLYNMQTKEEDLDLKSIKNYSTKDNLVVIEDENSKYGLIKITEAGFEYLIRPSYDNLGVVNLELSYLVAQDKDAYYIVDSTGKKLSSNFKNVSIQSLNKDYIVGEIKGSYSLYNYSFEDLINDYDYIKIHDAVISLVKNNRLYLVDTSFNKLSEDGIRLENKNYVKKYVYDKDNRLIDTLVSYEIEEANDKAVIRVGNDTKEINILEGKASSNYDYMSYLDGKLYFYSDSEKTDVIGTYTCNNKNNITSASSEYANCSIYKGSTGISGIYNNQYVFISDNLEGSKNYYLYDLKNNKNKGTYTSLEFMTTNELNSNIKPIYTSSSFIIAKSGTGANTGNFGVLEIASNGISGKIEFKYKSIENVNGYYLLINTADTYSLYNKEFEKVSNEFNYIASYDNYYVGISNNKLNVYSYNNALGILESDLEVKDNEFEINFEDGFNITIDGVLYSYTKEGKIKNGE